jgi:hypothetical protein
LRFSPALAVSAVALLLAGACGGSSSSDSGGGPTGPSTPNYKWSVSGSVVDTVAHQSVPGATIKPSWNLAAVSTNSDGNYSLGSSGNPPANPSKVMVSADGFVSHEQWVPVRADQRTDVTLDLIRNAAPFSMDYYRQLVRGTFDQEGAPYDVLRWEQTPKFYIKITDQLNRTIAADVINVIRDGVTRAVPAWTGGKYTAVIESGKDLRLPTPGWVNIVITTDPGEHVTCGQSYIGRDPGEINLVINPVCSCGAVKIPGHVVVLEVGHALGFFHVSDKRSVMYPAVSGCTAGEPSAEELYHAAIAYQRPRGNTDPDVDPSSSPSLRPRRVYAPPNPVKD